MRARARVVVRAAIVIIGFLVDVVALILASQPPEFRLPGSMGAVLGKLKFEVNYTWGNLMLLLGMIAWLLSVVVACWSKKKGKPIRSLSARAPKEQAEV